jgi:cell division protein FtsQ
MAKSYLLHDERFVIPSSASIEFEGNSHVTRAQLLGIFGGDVERNIFTVSLEQRRAELEKLPWVAHATVMRLLPNRMRVSVVERTPVAFVRQGSHIGLVDVNGVLLTMPVDAQAKEHYSFPVVTGISGSDPVSTRSARMKIFERFTSELDGSGEKISEELSEVDLSNPEDVQALIPDHSMEILVHFGEDNFLERYRRFKEHLQEWRTLYPKLSSVDMRYEQQVVLQMPPGSDSNAVSAPVGDANALKAAASVTEKSGETPVLRPTAKTPIVGVTHSASESGEAGLGSAGGLHPTLRRGAKDGAPEHSGLPTKPAGKASIAAAAHGGAKKSAPKAKPHAAAAKHNPVVTKHPAGTTQHHPTQVAHP